MDKVIQSSDTDESRQSGGESGKTRVVSESLQMLMASLGGSQDLPVTEEHISEMLSQRRQVNEFVNEGKKRDSYDQRYCLTIGLLFIVVISALIIFTHPEYFTQVLSLIIGGFGGFGLGRASKKD